MQVKVVLASNNEGKVSEFNQMIKVFNKGLLKEGAEVSAPPVTARNYQVLQIGLISQASLGIENIEETGLTFVENAILKARHASRMSGYPAIADDSGLEVDVLGGAPGIYSARYAAEKTDLANNLKLLNALDGVQNLARIARFRCVLVYLRNWQDPSPIIAEGTLEGSILAEPKGTKGFGYDPLFYVPQYHQTLAEMAPSLKNAISHRFYAFNKLINALAVGG